MKCRSVRQNTTSCQTGSDAGKRPAVVVAVASQQLRRGPLPAASCCVISTSCVTTKVDDCVCVFLFTSVSDFKEFWLQGLKKKNRTVNSSRLECGNVNNLASNVLKGLTAMIQKHVHGTKPLTLRTSNLKKKTIPRRSNSVSDCYGWSRPSAAPINVFYYTTHSNVS